MTTKVHPDDGLKPLGSRIGSLRYLGKCPRCQLQHMSTHTLVASDRTCMRCYHATRRSL